MSLSLTLPMQSHGARRPSSNPSSKPRHLQLLRPVAHLRQAQPAGAPQEHSAADPASSGDRRRRTQASPTSLASTPASSSPPSRAPRRPRATAQPRMAARVRLYLDHTLRPKPKPCQTSEVRTTPHQFPCFRHSSTAPAAVAFARRRHLQISRSSWGRNLSLSVV